MLSASGDLVKMWAMKGHRVLKELRWVSQQTTPLLMYQHSIHWASLQSQRVSLRAYIWRQGDTPFMLFP